MRERGWQKRRFLLKESKNLLQLISVSQDQEAEVFRRKLHPIFPHLDHKLVNESVVSAFI